MQLPRCVAMTVDFMAPGRRVKIAKNATVFGNLDLGDLEDDDPRRIGEPRRHRVYEIKKIIDVLYRSIDKRSFFQDLHERTVSNNDSKTSHGVLTDLWKRSKLKQRDSHGALRRGGRGYQGNVHAEALCSFWTFAVPFFKQIRGKEIQHHPPVPNPPYRASRKNRGLR